jgi:hypothetical protein
VNAVSVKISHLWIPEYQTTTHLNIRNIKNITPSVNITFKYHTKKNNILNVTPNKTDFYLVTPLLNVLLEYHTSYHYEYVSYHTMNTAAFEISHLKKTDF